MPDPASLTQTQGAHADASIPLGPGGPLVAPLGVGTWAWGDRGYWGYGRSYGDDDLRAAYRAARTAGITLFDTAELYGRGTSERLLGRFIADASDTGVVAVASKFAPLPWRTARRGPLRRALEASLRRLDLDRLALYQIHWPLPLLGDEPWLADLADAVTDGLISAAGVSNYGPDRLRRAHATLAHHGVPLATNQVEYSLLQRRPEHNGLLQLARDLDVTLIAYSPLAQGLLTGKYRAGSPPSGVRRLRARKHLPRLPALLEHLQQIGAAHAGATPAQVALNWLTSQGVIAIPGAKNADQAAHNAAALGWHLTPAETAALDAASQ